MTSSSGIMAEYHNQKNARMERFKKKLRREDTLSAMHADIMCLAEKHLYSAERVIDALAAENVEMAAELEELKTKENRP